jgi:hypothetical protein
METREIIIAYGHENILATNRTTLEITRETHLTLKGDCIIAVAADKSINDLSQKFRDLLRNNKAKLSILIEAGGEEDIVNAVGNSQIVLRHPTDIVIRKSSYICGRTLAIQADKVACDLSRRLVEKLKNPEQKVEITVTATI